MVEGKASYYYTQPYSWQFCVIYADYTAQLWQQKLVDGVPTMLSYLGILNMFYSWYTKRKERGGLTFFSFEYVCVFVSERKRKSKREVKKVGFYLDLTCS